jgi:hypothetical protein
VTVLGLADLKPVRPLGRLAARIRAPAKSGFSTSDRDQTVMIEVQPVSGAGALSPQGSRAVPG